MHDEIGMACLWLAHLLLPRHALVWWDFSISKVDQLLVEKPVLMGGHLSGRAQQNESNQGSRAAMLIDTAVTGVSDMSACVDDQAGGVRVV